MHSGKVGNLSHYRITARSWGPLSQWLGVIWGKMESNCPEEEQKKWNSRYQSIVFTERPNINGKCRWGTLAQLILWTSVGVILFLKLGFFFFLSHSFFRSSWVFFMLAEKWKTKKLQQFFPISGEEHTGHRPRNYITTLLLNLTKIN